MVSKVFDTIKKINEEFKTTTFTVEQKVREALRVSTKVYELRI